MKKLIISTLFVLQTFLVFAQQTTSITGIVVDAKTQNALPNVIVLIQNSNKTQTTDTNGKFVLGPIATGNYVLEINLNGYKQQLLPIELANNTLLDIGTIILEEDLETSEKQLGLITITDNDLSDDNSGSESTSGLLQATRDVFQQAAAYNFGQARFSVRGIDNEYSTVLINGIAMNRLSDGRPQYANWGGLNDATRNQEFTSGSGPSDYTFGGIAGIQYMNTRVGAYRPGSRVSFLSTNTNYNYRAMATYASGIDKDGWGFVLSASKRWANDAFFEGTNYNANSLFASVEKRFNDKHAINFTTMYAQNKRGKNSPNTKEVNDLMGYKYNSYWGYQNDLKRNSRVKEVEEPIMILSHYWTFNPKTKLNTNISFQTGKIGNSRLEFQNAKNPDPTYYKNLPSYYTTWFNAGIYAPNHVAAENAKTEFLASPQINWTDMYRINKINPANGSRYALYEDRTDDQTIIGNTILASQISDNLLLNAGLNYTHYTSNNFKNMLDLLGGTFYTDINTFGQNYQQQQTDLFNPERKIGVGDKYGYNYALYAKKLEAFTQFKFSYKKVDFYVAQTFTKNDYQREGFYKNGYYPTESYGKSQEKTFENFGFKGGLTYKISGKHLLDVNGIYMTKAPNTKDVYPNARLNNKVTDNINNEKISSIDVSYIIRAPKLKTRITGYFNEVQNATDVAFYFADGLANGGNFVAEIVTGINKRNRGLEFGLEYLITSSLKFSTAAAYGEYIYTNNPNLVVSDDDAGTITNYGQTQISGYKVSGMPQQAYSVGLEYRDPKFWWIAANGNYLSNNYLDVAPILRTQNFITASDKINFPYNQEIADKLLTQEKFDSFYLVNLSGGKSWRIKTKTLGVFVNINNLLDTQYKTGGFEQARNASYSELYKDNQGDTRAFGNKYFYGYGRTYMVNLYLNF